MVDVDAFRISASGQLQALLENASDLLDLSLALAVVHLSNHVSSFSRTVVILLEVSDNLGVTFGDATARSDLLVHFLSHRS